MTKARNSKGIGLFVAGVISVCVLVSGCRKPDVMNDGIVPVTEQSMPLEETASIARYEKTNLTGKKVLLKLNGEERDVTKDVVTCTAEELCLSMDGFVKLFCLSSGNVLESDQEVFSDIEKDSGFLSTDDSVYYKFFNEKHTLILKEGSVLCVADGHASKLESPVVMQNGVLSIPVTRLVLMLGYDSIGRSVEENSVIYEVCGGGGE